ncbi:ATP-binding protein [Petrotoga sibirica]|nr:ATP-binding protein [Petrotoga sibirica]
MRANEDLKKLSKVDLLKIDELGYVQLSDLATKLMFL